MILERIKEMKIKIIDLLNKISNGEKIPKKIKYGKDTYIHIDNYCYYCEDTNLILSDRIFAEYSKLNDEIEIIEEDKKISFEKIEELTCGTYDFETQTINLLIKNQKRLIDEINKIKENR